MSVRKIKIVSTLGAPSTFETSARTLAELKPLLTERGIDYGSMKLLVGETKNELSEDAAILPEGDFKLFLVPAKTKSGYSGDYDETDFEAMEETLTRIEQKQDQILGLLRGHGTPVSGMDKLSVPAPSAKPLSYEDMKDQEELRKLTGSDW